MTILRSCRLLSLLVFWSALAFTQGTALADEDFIIAASPKVKPVIEALGNAFEQRYSGVRVHVYARPSLDMRHMIATLENDGRHYDRAGLIHLIAPGRDELITRLEQKYYVLPSTRTPYAIEPLVLVASKLADIPDSPDQMREDPRVRVAVADAVGTMLGRASVDLLRELDWDSRLDGRLRVASDARAVLDHVLNGGAEVGILWGADAARYKDRLRVVAVVPPPNDPSRLHSIAMERNCPNRRLCQEFLSFVQTPEAQAIVEALGYAAPPGRQRNVVGEKERNGDGAASND